MKTIITVHDMIEALSTFNQDDIVVIDLQTDIPFNDDLYGFSIDAIPLSGMEGSRYEIRLCPKQSPKYKGRYVEIRPFSKHSKYFVVWDIAADMVFANEKFKSVSEAHQFVEANEMVLCAVWTKLI